MCLHMGEFTIPWCGVVSCAQVAWSRGTLVALKDRRCLATPPGSSRCPVLSVVPEWELEPNSCSSMGTPDCALPSPPRSGGGGGRVLWLLTVQYLPGSFLGSEQSNFPSLPRPAALAKSGCRTPFFCPTPRCRSRKDAVTTMLPYHAQLCSSGMLLFTKLQPRGLDT